MAWTQIIDDQFVRSDASAGSPGNNWIDVSGNRYGINSNRLFCNSGGSAICARPTSENQQDQRIQYTYIYPGNNGTAYHLGILRKTGTNSYYYATVADTVCSIVQAIDGTTIASQAISPTVGHQLRVTFDAVGVSPTVLTVTVEDLTSSTTLVNGLTVNDSKAGLQSPGQYALSNYTTASTLYFQRATTFYATVFTSGIISLTSRAIVNGNPQIVLSTTAPTNGTAPYIYQWHRSTTTGFTPGVGTAISGATSTTLTDNPPTGAKYYYKCVYTDSASGTVTSNELSIVAASKYFYLGFIGDSITYGYVVSGGGQLTTPPPTQVKTMLETLFGFQMVDFTNQGISGSKTADWLTGGTNYNNAISAFNSAPSSAKKYAAIMLGTNDGNASVSASTYLSNIQNLCNGLISNGITPILMHPIYTTTTAIESYLIQYRTQLNSLIDGNQILQGDIHGPNYFSLTISGDLQEGVHPTQQGATRLGNIWAYSLWRTLFNKSRQQSLEKIQI